MNTPMRERRPRKEARGWVEVGPVGSGDPSTIARSHWRRGPVSVISALELAELPDRSGAGPQWHVSVSRFGKRPKPIEVERALRAFGMLGTEEDNHHPGGARHFWLPVDPEHRVDCECKTDEDVVVDPTDGYRWTNPRPEAGACRGCELAGILRRPCPIHAPSARVSP